MTDGTPPIGEDDLHAYIDDQLDAERRLAVERYLDTNPAAAERVAIFKDQRDLIREAFATASSEPIPRKLSAAHIMTERSKRRPWLFAASVAGAFAVGGSGGWFLHAATAPGRMQQAMVFLEQEALTSHAVYAVDQRHPVEVPGTEMQHLQQWLSNRLDRTVVAPDLSALGYHLIGGRLLATEHGRAAALLMYDDASHRRISLLLRPMAVGLRAPDVAIEQNGVNGRAWIADGLGVAVVAAVPTADIAKLVNRIGSDLSLHSEINSNHMTPAPG